MNQAVIGTNAGIVWRIMDGGHIRQRWSFSELKRATGLSDMDLYAAVGWLARENKVEFFTDSQTEDDNFFLSLHYSY